MPRRLTAAWAALSLLFIISIEVKVRHQAAVHDPADERTAEALTAFLAERGYVAGEPVNLTRQGAAQALVFRKDGCGPLAAAVIRRSSDTARVLATRWPREMIAYLADGRLSGEPPSSRGVREAIAASIRAAFDPDHRPLSPIALVPSPLAGDSGPCAPPEPRAWEAAFAR